MLQSLDGQIGAPAFEVVVIDNDPEGSARAVCDQFAGDLAPIYCREALPGVAAVRNRAIAESRGEFLAFIDDDEWALPDWLSAFHATLVETGADAAFGNISNSFAPDVKPYVRTSGMFDTFDLPDRSDMKWWQTRTGNAYVRRSSLPDPVAPFDLRHGLTGGEDSHMFKRMLDSGACLLWSSRAVVGSFHARPDADMSWLFRRALRYGATGTEIEWLDLPLRRRARLGLRSTRRALRDFGLAALHWRSDKARATRLIVAGAMSMGRVLRLFGHRIEIYRRANAAGTGGPAK